jgi:hypothetical protein
LRAAPRFSNLTASFGKIEFPILFTTTTGD